MDVRILGVTSYLFCNSIIWIVELASGAKQASGATSGSDFQILYEQSKAKLSRIGTMRGTKHTALL